mgnify:CR=1 FL=1
MLVCVSFFFQAEDGIRDLVRSRGLGDVYKRQMLGHNQQFGWSVTMFENDDIDLVAEKVNPANANPVSYTHLTLPTSDLV